MSLKLIAMASFDLIPVPEGTVEPQVLNALPRFFSLEVVNVVRHNAVIGCNTS